ncbi:MAG TPA: ATP-dependent RecD-like DNA helicase, partial [Desulfobacteraceae bacterium]|nr:ATP-dependent RecD-like DNA helicase [Desulfobacteraceae bacterium]
MTSDLQGQIERITYTNDENGYTVAKIKAYGHHDLITVVGNFMSPMPGEVLDMKGEWHNHPKFGQQFKVLSYHTKVPATVYGIRKYLGSGLIKGLGPIIAERIVSKFGENTLDVIEEKIESLNEVEGIGKKRIAMIQKAWEDQKEIREVMVFLQTHGVSSGYAAKIFKQYGKDAINIVQENPYRLATDIFGIGFITADRIAQKIGFAKDSPLRASAGVLYVLNQLADEGHVYYPYDPLIDKASEILELGREIAADAIAQLAADRKLVIEDLNNDAEEFKPNHKAVFLTQFHVCESGIAHRLKLLLHIPKAMPLADPDATIQEIQSHKAIQLAAKQIQAVKCAIQSKVMVITGGPGTGKTTIIDTVINVFKAFGYKMLLAAPTGRAAKRMNEATGHPAKTIHRLLEYSMAKGGFQKNYENPLDCDALIIDEASMIDTVLMYHLLKAVPNRATLILVGDVNQLPSVGAGNVLNDIIESGAVPVVSLTEIFRQAKQSRIIVNAHRINEGHIPYSDNKDCDDFYFIEKESPEDVLNIILRLAKERIPARFGFHPIDDIQVLTP